MNWNMVLQKFNLIYGKLLRAAEKGQDLPVSINISRRPSAGEAKQLE